MYYHTSVTVCSTSPLNISGKPRGIAHNSVEDKLLKVHRFDPASRLHSARQTNRDYLLGSRLAVIRARYELIAPSRLQLIKYKLSMLTILPGPTDEVAHYKMKIHQHI